MFEKKALSEDTRGRSAPLAGAEDNSELPGTGHLGPRAAQLQRCWVLTETVSRSALRAFPLAGPQPPVPFSGRIQPGNLAGDLDHWMWDQEYGTARCFLGHSEDATFFTDSFFSVCVLSAQGECSVRSSYGGRRL